MKKIWFVIVLLLTFVLLVACGGGGVGGGGSDVGGNTTITENPAIGSTFWDEESQEYRIIFSSDRGIILPFGKKFAGEYICTDENFEVAVEGDGNNYSFFYTEGTDDITCLNWVMLEPPLDGEEIVYTISTPDSPENTPLRVVVVSDFDPADPGYQPAEIILTSGGDTVVSGYTRNTLTQLGEYNVVEVINLSSGAIKWVATDREGNFSLAGFPSGEYQVRVLHLVWDVAHTYQFPEPEFSSEIIVTL